MAEFADYYREIYAGGWRARRRPSRSRSRSWSGRPTRAMEQRAANYVFAGAGGEETMRANREALRRRRIVPRMLRDVGERDLSTHACSARRCRRR